MIGLRVCENYGHKYLWILLEIVMFLWINVIYFLCNLPAILMVSRTELQMYRCLRTVSFGEVKYTGFLFNKID